jgi:hypothetical protein
VHGIASAAYPNHPVPRNRAAFPPAGVDFNAGIQERPS